MKKEVPDSIKALVARFEEQRESYLHSSYKEAQLRREFVDPMWKALGWDMDNEQGFAEQYKEVIHEDAIKLSSSDYSKAPDYCFRIGGVRKFFLEAKKPSVDVAGDPGPAFQLRSYAWSEKLPLSVLSDFEELSVYDTRVKPFAKDKASAARIISLRYTDYLEKWDEIAGIFSKDAVLKGSFDKYAETAKKKRGTTTVDEDFLAQIESWRDELARNIATRNRDLTQAELNFAVQATIDRIVFLRICEDRGIEEYQTLFATSNGHNIYPRLVELFRRADKKYNSGLFHFSQEKGRTAAPDSLTPNLDMDDAVLRGILRSLYYPESPYVFSALPADILGQVYEQFLGKVIRLTPGHQAKVEEKPEVKKAGGVYYTPTYIVDYIVKHTLGPLLDGKTPKQVAGGKDGPIRVLDPACGSGTFLLQAYQYLLDWYRDAYEKEGAEKNSKGKAPVLYQGAGGAWRLTTGERKRILTTHIFGVDIDNQAVEVTKLSLLLRVLEGESNQTIQRVFALFHERALPDLDQNIQCGNSLIGPDFFTAAQYDLISNNEAFGAVNAFDWQTRFGQIMARGGFNAVIGNPPYVLLQGEFRNDRQLEYFRERYSVASFKVDTYHLFMERGVKLVTQGGFVSFITPSNFLTNNHLSKLRRFLLTSGRINEIVVIDSGVFAGLSVDNAIVNLEAGRAQRKTIEISFATAKAPVLEVTSTEEIDVAGALKNPNVLFTGGGEPKLRAVLAKIELKSTELGRLADVNFGKQLRDRKKFLKDVIEVSSVKRVPKGYRPCYTGKDVSRYRVNWHGLACRSGTDAQRGGCWDPEKQDAKNKILTKQIGRVPDFGIDSLGYQCLNTMFMVNVADPSSDPYAILAQLNSRITKAVWLSRYFDRRRTFPEIKGTYLKRLPLFAFDRANPVHRKVEERLKKLARKLTKAYADLSSATTSHARGTLESQTQVLENAIDSELFALYGLSLDEIETVREHST